ncbi:MAG: hypothetical protein WCK60_01080 [Candidatus Nomurabacteria bacterium]
MSIIYIYKLFTTKDALKAWYKKRLLVNSLSMVGIILLWGIIGFMGSIRGVGMGGYAPTPSIPYAGGIAMQTNSVSENRSLPNMVSNYYRGDTNTIKDTREFIKKSFNATLKTREVEDISKKVEVLIKGMDGRIDSSNISEQYGNISFVIPKSKLDEFETQLRTYTNKKLYSQNISSQNLLNEKQNLERNQGETKSSITALTTQQKQAETDYEASSKVIKTEINAKNNQLTSIKNNILRKESDLNNATSTIIQSDLSNQLAILRQTEQNLVKNIQIARSNLDNLTTTFKLQMSSLGFSLDQQNNTLTNLATQEDTFFDKIETVDGYVSINYVSVWEMVDIYSPINPIIILLVLAFITRIYFLNKKEKEIIPVVTI